MMKFTTILKDQSFWSVKRQFTKKEGELLKYLIPPGCEVIHYEIEFTTKNKVIDFFYRQIIRLYFLMRKVKYRLFFIFN
jgi:hypothetical protein